LAIASLNTLLTALMVTHSAFAQGTNAELTTLSSDAVFSLNLLWMILTAFMILWMQAGFALLHAGLARSKNAVHTMSMGLMILAFVSLGYWALGFAFQFGGIRFSYPNINNLSEWSYAPSILRQGSAFAAGLLERPLLINGQGVLGFSGFLLTGAANNAALLSFFFFQLALTAATTAIAAGAASERIRFAGYAWMTLWVSIVIYPLVGNWVWGGGWLANLGRSLGLGNGVVDYAGSGVIHMTGGAVALAAAIALGPRIGRFNRTGDANLIAGHNLPLGLLGAFILCLGWLAVSLGASLGMAAPTLDIAVAALLCSLLAMAASAVITLLYAWRFGATRKPEPVSWLRGVLAGAAAIAAPAIFVDLWAAVVIGLVAGLLAALANITLERMRIDDPAGAVSVHLVGGMWGLCALGFFANGNPNRTLWNGIGTPVRGLIFGGNMQMLAQIIGMVAILTTAFGLSYLFFALLRWLELLRVSVDGELTGLDISELGSEGYPPDFEPSLEALRKATERNA
jgi:Amt family ammonium transporter